MPSASIPAALATASAVAAVGGAVVTGVGAIQQGRAASESAKYNAEVAANNAKIAQQNATWAAQAGEVQAEKSQMKTRAVVGGMIANQAAAGIDVGSGSATDVRSSAKELGELDAINIRSDAARTAYGYDVQSANATAQGQLDKFQAGADTTGSYLSAGGSVLGGVGSAGLGYTNYLHNGNGSLISDGVQ